jgi:peptidoglycan/LPS O-acetylase OafA/YrhL
MKLGKLEAIRGFAAVYVVIYHFVGFTVLQDKFPAIAKLLFRFGQEAVILFFLLSGFVIYLSVATKPDTSFKKFFLKRLVRIYPILIISFILSIVIGITANYHFAKEDLKELAGNLFMLQDVNILGKPGLIVKVFMNNDPLWSLSYEWWFYMLFYPLFFYLIKKGHVKIEQSMYAVLLLSVIGWLSFLVFPNHMLLVLSYFTLWWAGAACAEIYLKYGTFTFKELKPVIISLSVMTVFMTIPVITRYLHHGKLLFIMYPLLTLRHYAFSLIVIFAGLLWWKAKLVGFDVTLGFFERFSKISYAIYVIHFPFIALKLPYIDNIYASVAIKLVLIFILAYLLEIKLQSVINGWVFKKKKRPAPILAPG